ncbi:enoyl-CoA hydratase/isomerase family protein, partial [Micromonospora sp. 4G55]|uniref:enoyl-CoA hydratase/isomerase family protein n=1 Tax=Micromonospora sp. 4G55 TaxID=2806102 RepID=UPI001A40BF2B
MSVSDAELTVEVTGAVATVTIRNPGRRNAMTPDMWRRLPVLLDALEADPAVRALVLTGADGTFCAGADLGDLDELLDAGDHSIAVVAEERLAAFAKPTIAAVQGPCVGGGCQLAVACDLRVAA